MLTADAGVGPGMEPALEVYAALEHLCGDLVAFQGAFPGGDIEEELERRCDPVVLQRPYTKLPLHKTVAQLVKELQSLIATRESFVKEARFLRHKSSVPLDVAVPDEILCMVVACLHPFELESVASVSSALARAVHQDGRYEWKIPRSQKGGGNAVAMAQHRYLMKHASHFRTLSTGLLQLDHFPTHRLFQVLERCTRLTSLDLGGTRRQQNDLLSVCSGVSMISLAELTIRQPSSEEGTACEEALELGLGVAAKKIEMTGMRYSTHNKDHNVLSVSHAQAAQHIHSLSEVSRLLCGAGISFLNLSELHVSFLDCDVSHSTGSPLFPALKSLSLERVRRGAGRDSTEAFGLHGSFCSSPGSDISHHFPQLSRLVVVFTGICSWSLPYDGKQDASLLHTTPARTPVHQSVAIIRDLEVASRELPSFVAALESTLVTLELKEFYTPFVLESRIQVSPQIAVPALELARREREQNCIHQWLDGLAEKAADLQQMHRVTQEQPLAVPSWGHVCRLQLAPSVPLLSVTISCSMLVPYLVTVCRDDQTLQLDITVRPHNGYGDDDRSWCSETTRHAMLIWPQLLPVPPPQARIPFTFGVDTRCIPDARTRIAWSLSGHHATRGQECAHSVKWFAGDPLFGASALAASSWFRDATTFSPHIQALEVLDVTLPNRGIGALYVDSTRFLHLDHLPHLITVTISVNGGNDGFFLRTDTPRTEHPIPTLTLGEHLPQLSHIKCVSVSVNWTHDVSPSLRRLDVRGRGTVCRSGTHSAPHEHKLEFVAMTQLETVMLDRSDQHDHDSSTTLMQRSADVLPGDSSATSSTLAPYRVRVESCPLIKSLVVQGLVDKHLQTSTTPLALSLTLRDAAMLTLVSVVYAACLNGLVIEECPSLSLLIVDTVNAHPEAAINILPSLVSFCTAPSTSKQRVVFVGRKLGKQVLTAIRSTTASNAEANLTLTRRVFYSKQIVPLDEAPKEYRLKLYKALRYQKFDTSQKGAAPGMAIIRHRHHAHHSLLTTLSHIPLFRRINLVEPDHTVVSIDGITITCVHTHATRRKQAYDRHYNTYFCDENINDSAGEEPGEDSDDEMESDDDV